MNTDPSPPVSTVSDASARLHELEKTLPAAVARGRSFSRLHWISDDWNKRWDTFETRLRRLNAAVSELGDTVAGNEPDRAEKLLTQWKAFSAADVRLAEASRVIRAQAHGLKADDRNAWNAIAGELDEHLEAVHDCARTLRNEVERSMSDSSEEAPGLTPDVRSGRPARPLADAADSDSYERDLQSAAAELDHEQHKFMGIADTGKALLMWVETTEERAHKNRWLRVEEA